MPRLVKGGKWVYGWVVVGQQGEITIPPHAWCEFSFQAGEEAVFVPGSRRSGGFGISTPGLISEVFGRLGGATLRALARGRFDAGCIILPQQVGVQPGDQLLVVRGSRYGLGFVAGGPIYAEALKHLELEVFGGSWPSWNIS
jgi:hypothetical protein